MKMKKFDLIETKLFHFHRIFKNGEQRGGFKPTPSGSPTVLLAFEDSKDQDTDKT